MPQPGDKMRKKSTGEVFQYDGTNWRSMGVVPQGAQPAPQYGQGAYQTDAGDIMAPTPKGGVKVLKQGGQAADASLKGRISMGAGPMVQAQETMAQVERQGNPFDLSKNADNALAKAVSDVGFRDFHPLEGIGKWIGGEDFQKYQQAASAFESQLMPIMSGAAVSPSEAQRQIRAALPQLGDSPETLKEKARTRAMMLNGAAQATGKPLPYPDVPTWGVNTNGPAKGAVPAGNDPLGIRRR